MKLITTCIVFSAFAFCAQPAHKEHSNTYAPDADKKIQYTDSSGTDQELQKAWASFAKAILHNDKKLIATLSTDCIYCCECVTNTQKEETSFAKYRESNPATWYDKLYKDLCYNSTEKFIKDDLLIVFDTLTKSRLLDSSRLSFHNSEINKGLYDKACVISSSGLQTAKCMEVIVTTLDPSSKTEGLQKAFTFVFTKEGYKFCGYSTIP